MDRCMPPKVFIAARDGNIDQLRDLLPDTQMFSQIRTAENDTVIHVHLKFFTGTAKIPFLRYIIDGREDILFEKNDNDEIPLITAAMKNQCDAVLLFLERCPSSIGLIDKEGENALHKALRAGFARVVGALLTFDRGGLEQDYLYKKNCVGETPLKLAVESKSKEIFDAILSRVEPLRQVMAYEELPSHPAMRSALHAAVILKDKEIVGEILRKIPNLIYTKDGHGQTPLHIATAVCWKDGLKLLLANDEHYQVAYIKDNDGLAAAHIAVISNNLDGLKDLEDKFPGSSYVKDNGAQNICHYAARYQRGEILEYLTQFMCFDHLFRDKDTNGDTSLHLFAHSILTSPIASAEFMSQKVIPLLKQHLSYVRYDANFKSPGDIVAQADFNKLDLPNQRVARQFMNVASISRYNRKLQEPVCDKVAEEQREKVALKVKTTAEWHMMVSIFIAAASFQASISVPGGFNQDDKDPINGGTCLLMGKLSFEAFIASNTITFIASIIATFLYFLVGLGDGRGLSKYLFTVAFFSTSISLATLVVSYMASVYATAWKSEITMYILYIAFWVFFLLYALFIRVAVMFLWNVLRTGDK